jgi:competence protein ComFC
MEQKVPISHTVIGFLPRSREKVRRYGFDQARELAKALAERTELPFSCVLRRVRDGVPQKTLGVRKRQENLRGAFELREDVRGKRVILVDDLVTTGAGMAEAARVLRRGGAVDVLAVSVAVTPKRTGKGRP